jgi:hypothetical protein
LCQDTHLDILWKFHKKTGVEWIDSRPSFILGVRFAPSLETSTHISRQYVKDNALNFMLPLLLYGAVTKYMGKKELPFPGDRASYDKVRS